MPRGRKDVNRNAFIGGPGTDTAATDGNPVSVPSISGVQSREERVAEASKTFTLLLTRDDGWLRVVPHDDGQVQYWKWKFAHGKHRNHYVMYRVIVGDWTEGVLGLAQKLMEVDDGIRKPAYDSPFISE